MRTGSVSVHIGQNLRGCGNIHRGGQEFQDQPATKANALRIGSDHHTVFGWARAGGNERPRTLQLHNTDAADIDRGESLEEAKGWRVSTENFEVDMQDLFEAARRTALGVEQALDEILENLEGLKRKPE